VLSCEVAQPLRRYLLAAGCGFLVGLAAAAWAGSGTRAPEPEEQQPEEDVEYDASLARRYSRTGYGWHFLRQAWLMGLLGAVAFSPLAARLRGAVRQAVRSPPAQDGLFALGLGAFLAVGALPPALLSGFVRSHAYGLSNQSIQQWLLDYVKSAGVELLIAAPLVALAWALIRRSPNTWWLWMSLCWAPLSLGFVLLCPVLIDPLFNKFEPVRDPDLRSALHALTKRAGVGDAVLLQMDRSSQDKRLSAYMWGIAHSKRIVLSDTIIARLNEGELLFVTAHEIAHYVKHHVWIGLGSSILGATCGFGLLSWLMPGLLRRFGKPRGYANPGDIAALPLFLLTALALASMTTPVAAAISRQIESQADAYALELVSDPAAARSAFLKLAAVNLTELDPPRAIVCWMYSHPPLGARIRRAEQYVRERAGSPRGVSEAHPRH